MESQNLVTQGNEWAFRQTSVQPELTVTWLTTWKSLHSHFLSIHLVLSWWIHSLGVFHSLPPHISSVPEVCGSWVSPRWESDDCAAPLKKPSCWDFSIPLCHRSSFKAWSTRPRSVQFILRFLMPESMQSSLSNQLSSSAKSPKWEHHWMLRNKYDTVQYKALFFSCTVSLPE